jgi:hypothetical protein
MKNDASASVSHNAFARALFWLIVFGLGVYAALTVWLAFGGMFFPYQLDYGEGIVLWFARQLAHGQRIYFPLGEPYATSNYPPVYLLLTALGDGLFGASYVWGRFLNFAATLLVTALIIRLVRGETRAWGAALLAGLLFFGSTFVYHWSPLLRIDMPGVACALAGIVCVWRWEAGYRTHASGSKRAVWLGWAILFFLVALYTKHSLVFAPFAAGVAIFLRDKRAGILFALLLGGIGGAIFLALEVLTRGGWSFGLLATNATVWTPRVFVPLVSSFVITYAGALVLGAVSWGTRVGRARRERNAERIGVLEIYAAAAMLSVALAGREGAWENYFFEAIAMTCVFAGITLAQWLRLPRARWVVYALLLGQLALFWNQHDPRIARQLLDETRAANEQVAPLIRAAQGEILSEDMGLLVTNEKPVVYYTFPYSTLARAGKWDQHWESENLRAGNFPLVVLMQGTRADVDHFGNFTRAFVSALDYGYDLLWQDAHYQVYAPAPLQFFEPRVTFGELFELVGWKLEPQELRAGEELQVTLVWRARQKPPTRYTAFAHLEDANGGVAAQDDHEPQQGAYPTTQWAQDEMVRDTFRLRIPVSLKPGEYVLRVGWYDTEAQDRLGLPDGTDFVELQKYAAP